MSDFMSSIKNLDFYLGMVVYAFNPITWEAERGGICMMLR